MKLNKTYSLETVKDVFDFFNSPDVAKLVQFCSYVKVEEDKDGNFRISEVDWTHIYVGSYDHEDLEREIKDWEFSDNITGLTTEGYYEMSSLAILHNDSDDYRSWTWLEPEIVEFEYQISLEEENRRRSQFAGLFKNDSDYNFEFI